MEIGILEWCAIGILLWLIYQQHFAKQSGLSRSNPKSYYRLNPVLDCREGLGCSIVSLKVVGPDTALFKLKTKAGASFEKTIHKSELEADPFQIACSPDPPRMWLRELKTDRPVVDDTPPELGTTVLKPIFTPPNEDSKNVCGVCGYKAFNGGLLKMHMRKKHPEGGDAPKG